MTDNTWNAYHRRDEVLRNVIDEANARCDGVLPMSMSGVDETFEDELALIGALQLRWHTRLSGRIETELMDDPADLESAVLSAWRATAADLVGVRQILDAYASDPSSDELAGMLEKAHRKDWILMAAMAGRASGMDTLALRAGQRLEEQARSAYNPAAIPAATANVSAHGGSRHYASLISRLKAHLVV